MDDLVICTGMSVLDIPVRGLEGIDPAHEHSRVKRVGMNLGGDAVNEAVVLTKLGVRTKLYASLSDDNGAKALANSSRLAPWRDRITFEEEFDL